MSHARCGVFVIDPTSLRDSTPASTQIKSPVDRTAVWTVGKCATLTRREFPNMPLSFGYPISFFSAPHEPAIPRFVLGVDMSAEIAVTTGIFAYCQHSDGSIVAICLRCYANAATANTLSELASLEAQHRCDKASGVKLLNRTMMSQK